VRGGSEFDARAVVVDAISEEVGEFYRPFDYDLDEQRLWRRLAGCRVRARLLTTGERHTNPASFREPTTVVAQPCATGTSWCGALGSPPLLRKRSARSRPRPDVQPGSGVDPQPARRQVPPPDPSGGLVAVLTSRFTLDAWDPSARREMAALADLVGAVRLRQGTFRASSDTDVVVDLLLLRRPGPSRRARGGPRSAMSPPSTETWLSTSTWAATPELILGTLRAVSGQYHQADVTVWPNGPLAEALDAALAPIVAHARASGLAWSPAATTTKQADQVDLAGVVLGRHHHEGSIVRAPGGGFASVEGGLPQPFEPKPESDSGELGALIDLRNALAETLQAQASSRDDDDAFADAQRLLNVHYDGYAKRYAPLNRFH
jgi:hypothetical protein